MNDIQVLMPLRNDFPPIENAIIRMVILVALAERAAQEEHPAWMQNENLNKRRAVTTYDHYLQQMISFVNQVGCFFTRVVSCGNNSYYKSELYTIIDNEELIVHVHHKFDPTAAYNRTYLNMNANPHRTRYAYIEYRLDSTRQHVNYLQWVVPDASGTPNRAFSSNIYPVLERIRGCVIGNSIERILHQFNDFEYVIGEN